MIRGVAVTVANGAKDGAVCGGLGGKSTLQEHVAVVRCPYANDTMVTLVLKPYSVGPCLSTPRWWQNTYTNSIDVDVTMRVLSGSVGGDVG